MTLPVSGWIPSHSSRLFTHLLAQTCVFRRPLPLVRPCPPATVNNGPAVRRLQHTFLHLARDQSPLVRASLLCSSANARSTHLTLVHQFQLSDSCGYTGTIPVSRLHSALILCLMSLVGLSTDY